MGYESYKSNRIYITKKHLKITKQLRLKGTLLSQILQIDSKLNLCKIGKKAKISQNQSSLNHCLVF